MSAATRYSPVSGMISCVSGGSYVALSDYTTLESERDALKQSVANSVIAMNALSAQSIEYVDRCAALEARNAGLEAGARRYRWLKDNMEELIFPKTGVFRGLWEELDSFIDAAIERESKP